jgi:hypothetical protein
MPAREAMVHADNTAPREKGYEGSVAWLRTILAQQVIFATA